MTQVALVTGASRGIGKAIALRLAQDGFDIAVNFAHNRKEADDVVQRITQLGRKALAVQADIGKVSDATALYATVEQALGPVHVLVNNAGVMKLQKIAEAEDALFDQMIDTNFKGTFHMLRLAGQHMKEGGRIINFSTSAIALALPGYAIYNASKAAVEALSYTFAKELRGRQITVNCIAPGPTGTDLFLNGKTEEQIQHLAKMPPLERLGTPEEIASVVSFLAGPDGKWVNAQVLRTNGGIV